ncbi:GATA zinc finger domain-containing protein 14-like isoform X3 [Aphidius gifuensis]|uniref:GATA zinc finger domain-containing protein 14-like isoform X3 n=1 Tax=Aphidius gifuensis TaxID=684658 RepID=UPI001CDBB6A2|nr:GATA zinc finger domain-containing protein 14-like isoform X3 [Aphidius gifuensis]
MSNSPGNCGGSASGTSGALSLMGCVREASPPPHDTSGMGEFNMMPRNSDTLPKEPKRRIRNYFRRLFRKKSRSAADGKIKNSDGDIGNRNREEVTLGHPAGRTDETRSQSAGELLTDSSDRQSKRRFEWPKKYRISLRKSINHVFLKHRTVEDSFAKLRVGSGQLSVSHDSVFPGEVPHTRPLSSLDTLATIERRQSKASDEAVHKDYQSRGIYNERLPHRQTSGECYQLENSENRVFRSDKRDEDKQTKFKVTRVSEGVEENNSHKLKGELPELESASLSHNAAHHRISVRPKNRRPPKRTAITNNISLSTTISETSEVSDSLDLFTPIGGSSPIDIKAPTILRKSSSNESKKSDRNSDIYDELETKLLSKKQTSIVSLSPDSLDSGIAKTMIDSSELDDSCEIKPVSRKQSNRISKGSDIFDELESKLPKKRLSSSRLSSKSPDSLESSYSKSIDAFDKYFDQDNKITSGNKSPVRVLQTSMSMSTSTDAFDTLTKAIDVKSMPRKLSNTVSKSTDNFDKSNESTDETQSNVGRKLLLPMTKSSADHVVSKSIDSLEILEKLMNDNSIERRRSSFDIHTKRGRQAISMSSENFEILNEGSLYIQKHSSASDVNLSRGKRHKIISKSIDSLEVVDTINKKNNKNCINMDIDKSNWRLSSKNIVSSSDSSDNIEQDDKIDNEKIRKPPKRIPSSSRTDIYSINNNYHDNDKKPTLMRKPSRLQKKSESSELGSTDTLNSDKKNKSFDSTETLDSLEKDLDQEKMMDNHVITYDDDDDQNNIEKLDNKNESWINSNDPESPNANGNHDKPYWRQNSETKENIDIHQLFAITSIVNGNNQRNNSIQYSGKKSPPTSPVTKQDDNKILYNSLIVNQNDDDLQNILNGNISEVLTTTKSFKEKLKMFERLGK